MFGPAVPVFKERDVSGKKLAGAQWRIPGGLGSVRCSHRQCSVVFYWCGRQSHGGSHGREEWIKTPLILSFLLLTEELQTDVPAGEERAGWARRAESTWYVFSDGSRLISCSMRC